MKSTANGSAPQPFVRGPYVQLGYTRAWGPARHCCGGRKDLLALRILGPGLVSVHFLRESELLGDAGCQGQQLLV